MNLKTAIDDMQFQLMDKHDHFSVRTHKTASLNLRAVDIGLENHAETREISFFDPKATPNPTLLSQWILRTYSVGEINDLILMIER